MQRKKSVKEEG